MGGFLESSAEQKDSASRPILLGVGVVVIAVIVAGLLLRPRPKPITPPDPYIANIKISDLKMGEAQNFVGAQLTYVDGTVVNAGDRTVTHITLHVVFKDSIGQVAQAEDVPLYILDTSGPYPDAVNLNKAPLAPRQTRAFRLTFEHVSEEWNRAYPDIRVAGIALH